MSDYPTTKQIAGKFYYGKLGDFKVIIDTENNTLNITKLCKYGGKNFFKWKENNSSKDLMNYYIKNIASPNSERQQDCCFEVKSFEGLDIDKKTADLLRGTYIPDLIAIQVAQWISPEYAIKVSLIVREKEIVKNQLLEAMNGTLKKEVSAKDDKIDSIMKKLKEMEEQNKVTNEQIKEQNNGIKEQNITMIQKIDYITNIAQKTFKILNNEEKQNKEGVIIYIDGNEIGTRAGKLSYLKQFERNKNAIVFDKISNGKSAVRHAKINGLIPKGNCCKFSKKNVDFNKLKKFFGKVDSLYEDKLNESEGSGFQTAKEDSSSDEEEEESEEDSEE
uniref:KilA-N domain-containing protein n=1 Tax=viral metagenome TaxID=1070528 RepID=A0A6C0LJ15_9ZZZZ